MSDLAAQLRTVAEHAPALRRAGVASLTVDGVTITLLPDEPVLVEAKPADEKPVAPLDDATIYGWPEGTKPPGFQRPGGKR